MKSKPVLKVVIILMTFLVSAPVFGQSFQSHGYDVDLNWKVKGKYLRIYGLVSGGRPCKKIKVNVTMANKVHSLATKFTSYTQQYHTPRKRTGFKGKSDLGRYDDATKGWYVEKLAAYCVGN